MNRGLSCVRDEGKGRPYILVAEEGRWDNFVTSLFDLLARRSRVILLRSESLGDHNWDSLGKELLLAVQERGVRQASWVGFSSAASLVQFVCFIEPKLVRTAIFVDAAIKPHPTPVTRAIDRLERFLPLGLPLRSGSKGFDGRAYLQRIRCPTLVVTSSRATPFERTQATELLSALPTAWGLALESEGEIERFADSVDAFQEVPAKCPQKGRGEKRGRNEGTASSSQNERSS